MGLKDKMRRACPTMKELVDTVDGLKTLVNELKADHNAFVAASAAKTNELVTQITDLRSKYTLHRASEAHPDASETTAVAGETITALSTTDNKASSSDVSFE